MKRVKLFKKAYMLSIITIMYKHIEGLFQPFLDILMDTLALFGFGLDSFIEVISGIGIAHMVLRLKKK
jgi:hypothetical protein